MNWSEVESEAVKLGQLIDPRPDVIVAIVRGGLIPGRILSSRLNVRRMYALAVEKVGSERTVTSTIEADLSGLNCLLVEDVLETGLSLKVAIDYLKSKGANVSSAAFYTTPQTEVFPDYSLAQKESVPVFPWE